MCVVDVVANGVIDVVVFVGVCWFGVPAVCVDGDCVFFRCLQ